MYAAALALWALFLIAAALYARRAGHPDAEPLASYLIFVTAFTVSALLCFVAGALLLQAAGAVEVLQHPRGLALFLAVVFVPPALLARWQMRQPPMSRNP